ATTERHRHKSGTEFQGLGVHLTIWIANKPRLMSVSVQPIDLETGAIFLAAPAAAALYVENVHMKSAKAAVTAFNNPPCVFRECNRGSCLRSAALSRRLPNLAHRRRMFFPY